MVQKAGKDHIPVNPSAHNTTSAASQALASLGAPARVPSPMSRPSILSVIEDIEGQESYKSQILMRRVFDLRSPRWANLDRELPTDVDQALKEARGVTGFYTHQAQAINSFWKGRNVIVSTATASGKSIIYQVRRPDSPCRLSVREANIVTRQVPALCALIDDPDATAVFIYPTKARLLPIILDCNEAHTSLVGSRSRPENRSYSTPRALPVPQPRRRIHLRR